jgi:non-heme chloroperoxidase
MREAASLRESSGCKRARRSHDRYGSEIGIGAVPPLMLKTEANPGGLPIEGFDGMRKQLAANRPQFYLDFASGPLYGYNRPGSKASKTVIWNWWRQSLMGGAKAHYDGIKAFSETDFTADLKSITVPTLILHGGDDQIVPVADSAPLSAKLLKKSTLKIYERLPHGMCTTHADLVNAELLSFISA